MNDPWDVKSVRQSGQYVSCMKMNGVPLLPPVLSKECRKEMQYYKLLAREVEKRISILQPYVADTSSDSEDKTDAPELPDYEQICDLLHEEMNGNLKKDTNKIVAVITPKTKNQSITESPKQITASIYNNTVTSNVVIESNVRASSPKLVIDLNLSINEASQSFIDSIDKKRVSPLDLPERDYNCVKKLKQKHTTNEKHLIAELEESNKNAVANFKFGKDPVSDPISGLVTNQDGPSSISSKSFTGSLNDLYTESVKKDVQDSPKLIRQRSYTLLKPGPLLQAHLEVQSISTGLDMNLISMSESVSNLNMPCKKRRSWDLESAKVKWSSMALELNQRNLGNAVNTGIKQKTIVKKSPQISPPRSRSVAVDRTRSCSVTPKSLPKSDPIQKNKQAAKAVSVTPNTTVPKESFPKSDTNNKNKQATNAVTVTLNKTGPKDLSLSKVNHKEPCSPKHVAPVISESEDPATRVRELYEKIQTQQLIQMASLVEKQKREHLLLQQVFEEQNNLLFKQLKTICPKSPIEAKEAWGDKNHEVERGPVSLSQLINHKSPDQSSLDSPVSSTLTDTNNYLSHCDDMLKKSRDITESIKKNKCTAQNGTKFQSTQPHLEGSRTRTHSPSQRSTLASRRLNYETSASSDREYDPILTDRTNDTMADLNVTFPSDNSDEGNHVISHLCGKEANTHGNSGHSNSEFHSMLSHTDNAIRNMERTIQNSINNSRSAKSMIKNPPTEKQRAAATKIVAHAKGFLVRRLMKTERVQTIVQTIKDALLCALQLHQDREGIRGADVDLHRRLIQQITAACYSLHDTFITSTPSERGAMIAADRGRRRSLAARQSPKNFRPTDIMSQSYSGPFPARAKRPPASPMTQSSYETFSGDKGPVSRRHPPSPRRRPWR